MSERVPHAYPLGEFLQEEMDARGWTTTDVAMRMGGDDISKNLFRLEMTLAVHDPNLLLNADMANDLEMAFNIPAEFFLNIDAAWRAYCALPEPPERKER
jgi:plasmid maintenance system antidote protein VapI